MSHRGNDEIKERLWEQVDSMTDAEVFDQALETSTWRSLHMRNDESWDEMRMSADQYRQALFLQMWNDYPEH